MFSWLATRKPKFKFNGIADCLYIIMVYEFVRGKKKVEFPIFIDSHQSFQIILILTSSTDDLTPNFQLQNQI